LLLAAIASSTASSAPFYENKSNLLVVLNEDGVSTPITNSAAWAKRRGHILENMQAVMGTLPNPRPQPALNIEIESQEFLPSYVRQKITFVTETGDRLPCYLSVPNEIKDPAPAMLCLHPTSKYGKGMVVGLGDKPNRNYADELARRGYVTLAPDYPGFGDYAIDVYAMGYVSATAKGIVNHMRCIDLLASLPQVDPDRIGSIGHSLGGHNTLYLGVFDTRVKVMVTSCGFNSFAKYYGGDLTGWSHKGYMPRIATRYGKDPARMPFDFSEVLGALAPRPVFISAPLHDANFEVSGVYDCIEAARPIYALLGNPSALQSVHPDCEHDFPTDVRTAAYAFIDEALSHSPTRSVP
jgi:dienelactone hydrolase